MARQTLLDREANAAFAIRGAKVVPVSGPPIENATVVLSGHHYRVGKTWHSPSVVIEGKGLTVYPVWWIRSRMWHPRRAGPNWAKRATPPQETFAARRIDRFHAVAERAASQPRRQPHRNLAQRGLHDRVSAPKAILSGQAAVLDLGGDAPVTWL